MPKALESLRSVKGNALLESSVSFGVYNGSRLSSLFWRSVSVTRSASLEVRLQLHHVARRRGRFVAFFIHIKVKVIAVFLEGTHTCVVGRRIVDAGRRRYSS
jgi:hypothetical protein